MQPTKPVQEKAERRSGAAVNKMKRETGLQWLQRHVDYDGDECLIWPRCRDNHGYGMLGTTRGGNRVNMKAHRVMCELINGPSPTSKHQASHSCGHGHLGCVHPKHLSWKTGSQNQLDRRKHGTAATNKYGQHGIVTPEMAATIISLKGKASQEKIATQFGISKKTVRNVFGRKWSAARSVEI